MTTTKLFPMIFLLVLLFTACKEEQLGPLDSDGAPPGPVSNVQVENLPGAALISYDIPDDPNLLYVKAVYQTNPETTREAKSSRHNNHLIVEGFATTDEVDVTLYAVSEGEHESEPVTAVISPLTPPVVKVFELLETARDFGGVNVTFQNEDETDIVISVITSDDSGEWVPADQFYTSRREGTFAVRGFEAEPRTFGFYVRDRWNNHSDTLFTEITPMYEAELDKSLFADARFPSDAGEQGSNQSLSNTWNGVIPTAGTLIAEAYYLSTPNWGLPLSFTIDLGVTVQLSRMKFWQRMGTGHSNPTGTVWNDRNARIFEIWGSNEWREDWDNWELLATFESVKPSGLPLGQFTNEDLEAALAGEEFIFPVPSTPIRYLRWNVTHTWVAGPGSTNAQFQMMEMSYWGDVHTVH